MLVCLFALLCFICYSEFVIEQRLNSGQFTEGNEFAWQLGESGNPAGRPKSSVTTLLKEKDRQGVADKLHAMALAGDLGAIREFLDRTEGKVSTDINLQGTISHTTPEMLEFFRNRMKGIENKSQELLDKYKEPKLLTNGDNDGTEGTSQD